MIWQLPGLQKCRRDRLFDDFTSIITYTYNHVFYGAIEKKDSEETAFFVFFDLVIARDSRENQNSFLKTSSLILWI